MKRTRQAFGAAGLVIALVAGCGGSVSAGDDEALYASRSDELRPRPDVGSVGLSRAFAERWQLPHGIAGDEDFVFITEPLVGRVVALDRNTGREVGEVTPPPGEGFVLPFTLRVPETGKLVIMDAGGFPDPMVPSVARVYDVEYEWDRRHRRLVTNITRTVRFDGLPVVFAEDLEVLPDGTYVMSESIIGGLWLILPDGTIAPGMFPSGPEPIPAIGACLLGPFDVGGIPMGPAYGPGVGSLAAKDGWLYFGSSCIGGLHRVPVATLLDPTRSGEDKANDVQTVSAAAPGVIETLKGLSFNRWMPSSRWVYAGDPFHLRLVRINIDTGVREVVSDDAQLYNFSVAAAFLPPRGNGVGGHELVVSSDQEHRFAGINPNIGEDQFQLPFVLTKLRLNPRAH